MSGEQRVNEYKYLTRIFLRSTLSLLCHPKPQTLPLVHGPEFDQELLCFPMFLLTLVKITVEETCDLVFTNRTKVIREYFLPLFSSSVVAILKMAVKLFVFQLTSYGLNLSSKQVIKQDKTEGWEREATVRSTL